MKKIVGFLAVIMMISIFAGCAKDKEETQSEPVKTDQIEVSVKEDETVPEEVKEETEEAKKVQQEEIDEVFDEDADIETYYSQDEDVALRLNYTDMTATIIDGNDRFPVEISMAPYGPYIEKCDVNDDNKDDYMIAECEGNGTGFCVYGLCILKKNNNDYDFFRYDGEYFSKILEERISHSFDNGSKEITFRIDNEKPLEYKKVMDTNEEVDNVIWSDIIRIRMIDKKPYLSAPSGFIYKEIPMPDYDQSVEVIAPIEINKDLSVNLGDISVVNDPNDLNEIRQILGLPQR
ncbi:MAG: hypothetical protein J5525_02005 [Lachnospiraceae bacterium]|nr:hypothetical protein [Lachnospiraceae bacterium]